MAEQDEGGPWLKSAVDDGGSDPPDSQRASGPDHRSPSLDGLRLALTLLAAGLVLLWTRPDGPAPEGYASRAEQAISLVSLLGPPLLGGLLAARRPANPYGWLWLAYGLGWAVVGFTNAYAIYVSASGGDGLPWWAGSIAWTGDVVFVPLLGLTTLILLLFPDGRPPSRRWHWVTRANGCRRPPSRGRS